MRGSIEWPRTCPTNMPERICQRPFKLAPSRPVDGLAGAQHTGRRTQRVDRRAGLRVLLAKVNGGSSEAAG
jgi:hypothetical protein